MALRSLSLRRTLSLLRHHRHKPQLSSTLPSLSHLLTHSNAAVSSSSSSSFNRPFTSTSALFLSQRGGKVFDPETDEIGPDTILFEGCDYNHWLITIDFPKDANLTREQMIETYVNTAAQVFGSVEEAKKKLYALSTTTYQGFQVECSEETSEKFKGLPGVVFVLPDSYIDPVNKEYGGDKYINGEIIPRPPPVHYGRQKYRDRDRRPREQMGYQQGPPQNYGPPQQQNYGQNFRPPPQQNYGPPPSQHNGPPSPPPPQQNYGPPPPQQNYRPPPQQNYRQPPPPPPQNYGPPPQQSQQQSNVPPHPQNYGQPPNFPPQQNYRQPPPNSAPQQNYGQPPSYAPQQNYGQPPNFPPRQNYDQPPNFPPQQNYGQPPRSTETRGPLPPTNAWGGGGINQAPSHGGNFNQGEGGNFHAQGHRDFQPGNPSEPKNY